MIPIVFHALRKKKLEANLVNYTEQVANRCAIFALYTVVPGEFLIIEEREMKWCL